MRKRINCNLNEGNNPGQKAIYAIISKQPAGNYKKVLQSKSKLWLFLLVEH